MAETLNSLVTTIKVVLLYAIPAILVLITVFSFTGIFKKFADNASSIVNSISNFLVFLETKKMKIILTTLTVVYIACVITYLCLA